MYVEYDSNNSGGRWWLKDKDWKALEKAGWIVEWANLDNLYTDEGNYVREENGIPKLVPIGQGNSKYPSYNKKDEKGIYRYLGALAKKAYKPDCNDLKAAVEEWEKVTKQSSTDAGCPCCGQPHYFTLYDDKGKSIDDGPHTEYSCEW